MRGNDWTVRVLRRHGPGRPPRARERRRLPVDHRHLPGTTPACAGTTPAPACRSHPTTDDPRVRGNDFVARSLQNCGEGRPPRARERRQRGHRIGDCPGTTPACAGTTTGSRSTSTATEDDPRVRGNDPVSERTASSSEGRPPRARERRRGDPRPGLARGTTPACAGTTKACGLSAATRWDDPRVRGNDLLAMKHNLVAEGRPPRARERLSDSGRRPGRTGTTPACAGTTMCRGRCGWWMRDDPRVRGNDPRGRRFLLCSGGRPPRARERRRLGRGRALRGGTTPACAGTTTCARTPSRASRDDPRVRGNDIALALAPVIAQGRPPRARERHFLTCADADTMVDFHLVRCLRR